MSRFTEDQVVDEASRRYGGPVCVDTMEEALSKDTLNEAVMDILLDTVWWASPTGNPFDEEIWARILPAKE